MDNTGRGRWRGRGGGGGGVGGRGRGRGQNRDQCSGTSNPSNYRNFPGQQKENQPDHGRSFRQEATPYQGQSGEPRSPISVHDRGLNQGPSSSQVPFAESTKPASAWVGLPWASRGGFSGGGGSSSSGRGGGSWKTDSVPGGSSSSGRGGGAWKTDSVPGGSMSSASASASASGPPISELRSLEISSTLPSSFPPESVSARRPDNGGTSCIQKVHLLANHFPINCNPGMMMLQYNINVEPELQSNHGGPSRVSNSDIRMVKNKLFSDNPEQFPPSMMAYDGGKIIVSAVELPTGKFRVDLPRGRAVKSYTLTIEFVKELELGQLEAYRNGTVPFIPRAFLQGMDLVMKENPKKHRVQIGQNFYSMNYKSDDDLGGCVVACRGFQQGLKVTSRGPALCVDYSVLPFRKPVPVLEFLLERVFGFRTDCMDNQLRDTVENELRGLKVTVSHRETNQKFEIRGLTSRTVNDLTFTLEDQDGINPSEEVRVVDYFKSKYNKEIKFKNLPCLDLGNSGKSNDVPMEFCVLVEGQIYPKDQLAKVPAMKLKDISLPKPWRRKEVIYEMAQAIDGPLRGETIWNFGIEARAQMTQVIGRVVKAPDLKLGDSSGRACKFILNKEECQWNLVGRTVLEGKDIERWAVLDFSSYDRGFKLKNSLIYDKFVQQLVMRCRKLRLPMKNPLFHELSDMHVLSDTDRLRKLLNRVYDKANRRLQILVCIMSDKHPGYNALKWICETEAGILTQLCLSERCNMGKDQYMSNVALQINTKLGGSNFELFDCLPHLESDDNVMFIGADVNHPKAGNVSRPSFAAVVATVNWPAANKYVGRYCLQKHRTEKIQDFGEMCLELINIYAELNKVKPKKIIVFRDGVSDSQFDMVLDEELLDLKNAICCEGYSPTITLVIAQKRHLTRLFPMDPKQGARNGNVFPGTVVDTTIVHPWKFDFYLCSHYGILGTSKPTHYYCLYDDHGFSSDDLQQLTYNLCYTYALCTKPVSLVPPAYYADTLAYRVQQYYEAWEAEAAASSSSSSLPLDPNSFKLHGDLEKIMFFC
ncbi:protein argonaute 2-like [Macadamia integrifolia]|uniref:protein argonaute 2-like n=1 Tax=Macadamia integrifolia TaxID=60698 RepID=UPI001C4EC3A6|nr:protein argonaute 2-like [Macadamia integrifolia]